MSFDPHWEEPLAPALDLRELMKRSATTAVYPEANLGTGYALLYLAAALAGEAGETSNQLKKVVRDDGGVLTEDRRARVAQELGGVMWYWLRVCAEAGLDPYDVVRANFAELDQRLADGTLSGDNTPEGRRGGAPLAQTVRAAFDRSAREPSPSPAEKIAESLQRAGRTLGDGARQLQASLDTARARRQARAGEKFATVDAAVEALMVVRPYFAEWHVTCLGATCRESKSSHRFTGDSESEVRGHAEAHALRYHLAGGME